MAINSNFSIYEPEAWVEVALANQYPQRPMVMNSVTNVAGADVEGLVANKNKSVNITRAVKTSESDVNSYTGSDYSIDTPDANEETLTIDTQEYLGFNIDKADQRFSLPDLVQQHFVPRLNSLIDKINSDIKGEARKFEAAFVDKNTDATVLDDEDLAFARQVLLERKFLDPNMPKLAVIDPRAENDLTGLSIFQQADQRGNAEIQLMGAMQRAYGFDFAIDNLGSDHTAANIDAGDRVAGGATSGDTTVVIDDGAGGSANSSLEEGNILYFGSSDDKDDYYVVDSWAPSTSTGTITLKEPLRADVSDDATINPVDVASGDTGKEQFFYDPEAIALVTAVMQSVDAPSGSGVRRAAGFDPMNGVNYTLTIEETKKGADVLIETLYGSHNYYEDRGVRYVRGNVAKA